MRMASYFIFGIVLGGTLATIIGSFAYAKTIVGSSC